MGCPSATAPPCTLTRSGGRSYSCIAAIVTAAKASLTSHRSTSAGVHPARCSTLAIAPTGAVVNQAGSCACTAWARMRATGAMPSSRAVDARTSTSAAAPSEMLDEVAAVMVPSLRNAGRSAGTLSSLALNGCSSRSTTSSPARAGTVTGAISQAKPPSLLAAIARCVEAIAKASWRSREKPYRATHCSANTPIAVPGS